MDRQIKKKKWTLKRIAWMTAGAAVLFFIVYYIFFGDHSSKLNVRTERITISTVREDLFQEFIPVTGNVIPINTVYLDAIEGGIVEKRFLEAGTYVEKGDKILRLRNTNLLLDIMYREAELFQQSNNLRNTQLAMAQNQLQLRAQILDLDYQIRTQKRNYERYKELFEKNLVAEQEYQDAKDRYDYLVRNRELSLLRHQQDSLFQITQIQQIEASLERMRNNLALASENLENLTLKAPISGQLTALNAEIGESKTRGERLGQIDVLDGFKVRVRIDEHYIARIDPGQKGKFTFDNQEYTLSITKVYPEVLNGRFEVDMEFDSEEPEGIRRGQTLHIRLELGNLSEAILLSAGGFYQKTGGQWVYVVDESGEFAYKRDIRLGRQNPEAYEVLEGLEPGEKVITSSYDSYGDVDKLILKTN